MAAGHQPGASAWPGRREHAVVRDEDLDCGGVPGAPGRRAECRGAVGEQHVVEDREAEQERAEVGHQPDEVHPEHVPRAGQVQPRGRVVAELVGERQQHEHRHRDRPERDGLAQHVRPARAVPRPAAERVADDRAGEPAHQGRRRRGQVEDAVADRERDLGRRQRRERGPAEPGEPAAKRAAEPALHGRDRVVVRVRGCHQPPRVRGLAVGAASSGDTVPVGRTAGVRENASTALANNMLSDDYSPTGLCRGNPRPRAVAAARHVACGAGRAGRNSLGPDPPRALRSDACRAMSQ